MYKIFHVYTDYYKIFFLPKRIAIIKIEHDGENEWRNILHSILLQLSAYLLNIE